MSKLEPIFTSPDQVNQDTDEAIIRGLEAQFPIENKNFKLTVSNIHADMKDFDHDSEKKAIIQSKSLTYPIKGDLVLTNKSTGKVVDTLKNFTLTDAYKITDKHTVIHKGNNYAVAHQLQLLPGIYARHRETGELEAHVNTGSNRSFRIDLDPKTGLFNLRIDGANSVNIPLAPIISTIFNLSPSTVSQYIPGKVWQDNLKAVSGKEEGIITKLYPKLVNSKLQNPSASIEEKIEVIRETLEGSKLHPMTTKQTLGKEFTGVTGEALLRTMKNLVNIHTGEREEDNRDSLQFKRVQSLPQFIETFYKKGETSRRIKSKLIFNLERINPAKPRITDALSPKPFNRVYSDFLTKSQLVYTPSETNPIESLENIGKVTLLGEGGISSERSVPTRARNLDPSNLGIIDPARTPESSSVGIDQRFSIAAHRDKEGILHTRVKDRNGKTAFISVGDIMSHTIGFPHQEGKKIVQAQVKGQIKEVPAKDVDYWIDSPTDMYTVTTNLVPFFNSNHSQRLTMAGKALPQALSLVNREVPMVQTVDKKNTPFVDSIGSVISTTSPVDGVVTRVGKAAITVKPDKGEPVQVKLTKNLPFNMKGFFDDETLLVKTGDRVKAGQVLVDNNYTKNGKLALGKNLYVGYMPYKGYNHEDGIVVSRSAAQSLDSHHAYKFDYQMASDTISDKRLFRSSFPGYFNEDQLSKLDNHGFAIVGAKLVHGDPIFALLERREPTAEDRIWGTLHKSLVNPFKKIVEVWNHEEPGEVIDAHTTGKDIRILVRSIKPLEIGDKLTGTHGNKGIVSLILEDHEMPYDKKTGRKMDLLLNPASVTSRINLGQIHETVASKIAEKTGKPYLISNFSNESNIGKIKEELAKHGVSDTDELVDPKTGKDLGKVLAGHQYMLKLYKTSDQNYSARGTGGYDINKQPTKGGEEGSKSIGYMEFLGLLGSNSRNNLREMGTLKSEDNTDYWTAFAEGKPLPKPKTTFATEKFINYLHGAGVKVNINKGEIRAAPLSDKDIHSMSHGEIKEPLMLRAKDLAPEKGGLFDTSVTGGSKGTWWSHYKLAEPMVNPMFETPVQRLLGLTKTEYMDVVSGKIKVVKREDGKHELIKNGKVVKVV